MATIYLEKWLAAGLGALAVVLYLDGWTFVAGAATVGALWNLLGYYIAVSA